MSSHCFAKYLEDESYFRYYLENGPGFSIKEINGDGNCLYASLAFLLYRDERRWPDVRKKIAFEIFFNQDRYKNYLTDQSVINRVETILAPGNWGGDLEISAAAAAYKVNIQIMQPNGYYPVFPADFRHSDTLHLSFHGQCHYNALVEAGTL